MGVACRDCKWWTRTSPTWGRCELARTDMFTHNVRGHKYRARHTQARMASCSQARVCKRFVNEGYEKAVEE